MATLTKKQMGNIRKALAKRKARKQRKNKSNRVGYAGVNKNYNYVVRPASQYLSNINSTTPNFVSVVPPSASGPIIGAVVNVVTPSRSGMAGYSDIGVGLGFSALDIANFSAMAKLYDQYKINWVKVRVTYLSNAASINGGGILPTVYSVQDNDDSAPPSGIEYVQGKQGCKIFTINSFKNSFTSLIKPKMSVSVNNGQGAATGIAYMQTNGWLDINQQGSFYYGLKLWFENVYLPGTAGQSTAIQFDYTYGVSFRGAQNLF